MQCQYPPEKKSINERYIITQLGLGASAVVLGGPSTGISKHDAGRPKTDNSLNLK